MKLINPGPSTRGSHRIGVAMECFRKFGFKYQPRKEGENGEQPWKSKDYFIKGSLVHAGLAHHYMNKVRDDYLPPLEAIQEMAVTQGEHWLPYVGDAQRVVTAHQFHWGEEPEWRVISVEKELKAWFTDDDERGEGYPNGDPDKGYLYTQRVDLEIQDVNTGLFYIVDHKTTYAITKKTEQQYDLTAQMVGYQLFGEARHPGKFGGLLLSYMTIPAPDKSNFSFKRLVVNTPASVRTYKRSVIFVERMVGRFMEMYDHPREWPASHGMHCYSCPYKDRCKRG